MNDAITPVVVDAKGLALMLNSSERSVRTWDAEGLLPTPNRIGRRVLWRSAEIQEWLAAGSPCREEWEARRRKR